MQIFILAKGLKIELFDIIRQSGHLCHNKQLQDEVARLKAEIGSLCDKLNEMSNCEPATPVQWTWSTVVKSKRSQNRTATSTVHNHCDQKSAVAAKGSHQRDSRKQENLLVYWLAKI